MKQFSLRKDFSEKDNKLIKQLNNYSKLLIFLLDQSLGNNEVLLERYNKF